MLLLLQGKSDGDVAKAVGVTRSTVNIWKNHDAAFIAQLNARRQELWEAQSQRLRGLVDKAIDVLEKDLTAPDMMIPQRAAVHILRAAGLYGAAPTPTGPATAEEVTLQQRMDEAALREKEHDAFLAESGLGGFR